MKTNKILVLTVGVGNRNRLEETLYIPVSKSIQQGEWKKVILLPSLETLDVARKIMERNSKVEIEIYELIEPGLENDADACFKHFDSVLSKFKMDGFEIVTDFTRGTKAMSAALVLAAIRHDVGLLRYVYGGRDENGTVVPGSEDVGEFNTHFVSSRVQIDTIRNLMAKGSYSASLELLESLKSSKKTNLPRELRTEVNGLLQMSKFFSAWDRFDYIATDKLLVDIEKYANEVDPASELSGVKDWTKTAEWIKCLKIPPKKNSEDEMHDKLKYQIVDLFANCERRVYHGQFEDAMVRMYCIIEKLGQRRLFGLGIDSGKINIDLLVEKNASPEMIRKLFGDIEKAKNRNRSIGQSIVLDLLSDLNDNFVDEIRKFNENGLPKRRNQSILIHGFQANAQQNQEDFHTTLEKLKSLILKDAPEMTKEFETARFLVMD